MSAAGMHLAERLGLGRSALETYAAFVNGEGRTAIQNRIDLDPGIGTQAYLFDQPQPFALGSLAAHSTRGAAKNPLEIVHSQMSRLARSADQHATGPAKKSPRGHALEAEVDQYIAELAGQRDEAGRRLVVRNGRHRPRTVTTAGPSRWPPRA